MNWTAKKIMHHGQKRIAIYFKSTPEVVERIKKLEGIAWSSTKNLWHVPDTPENRDRFNIALLKELPFEQSAKIEKFRQWLRSKRTPGGCKWTTVASA